MNPNNRYRSPAARLRKQQSPTWPFVLGGILLLAILVGGFMMLSPKSNGKQPVTKNDAKTASSFDKSRYSIDDPASIWVVVNKQRPLSSKDYAPADLRAPAIPLRRAATSPEMQLHSEAATALEELASAAKKDGINLMLASGYRSYDVQVAVYNSEVKGYGQVVADQESARPGHSEHQTGLAADLEPTSGKCEIEQCFGDTPEGKWIAANAYKYGFIVRYVPGKTAITGYKPEPWHVRYIGKDLAAELHRQKTLTLEEFFSLPAAPNY